MKVFLPLLLALSAACAVETNQPPNRPALTITAGYSVFNLRSNEFLYTNHVIVIDPPGKPGDSPTILTCRWAVARAGVNRRLESVVAHETVAIDQGDNHARGALAVYTATNETMTLTGAFHPEDTNTPPFPALFSSQGTNYGTKIIYERLNDRLLIDRPQTIIPHTSISNAERGKTNSAATNRTSRFGTPFPTTK
jgi:hypothetical protein